MAGLLDFFTGGGGDSSGAGLYGDLLNDQQKAALQQRGLLGFLGGMQKSGALDYTAPFLSGKVPGGFAAGLAGGMAGMGEAQDAGAMNALRAMLIGQQGQQLKSQLAVRDKLMGILPSLIGGDAGGGGAVPSTAAPGLGGRLAAGGALTGGGLGADKIKQYALNAGFKGQAADDITAISLAESSGNPNAVNPDDPNGGSFGLTQINGVHPGARTAIGDPQAAMDLAFRVSNGGTNFKPWTTFTSGAYRKYLGGSSVPAAPGGLLSADAAPSPAPAAAAGTPPPFTPPPGEISVPGKPGVVIDGKWYPSVKAWNLAMDANSAAFLSGGAAPSAQPAPQGPLAMPAAAPAGGAFAQLTGTPAPAPSPAPAASAGGPVAASPSLVGGMNPRALAAAGVLAQLGGIGDAFKPLEQYYYNSPGYKGTIAEVESAGKERGALPYVAPAATAKAAGERSVTEPSDIRIATAKAEQDRITKALEQTGAAALDATTIVVSDGKGGLKKIPATRQQVVAATQGFGVPELGIPPLRPGASGQQPGGGPAPGGALGEPVFTPEQSRGQEGMATAGVKALDDAHAAELSANRRTQSLGQMAEAMKGFVPGATMDMQLRATRVLRDLGVPGLKTDNVPAAEVFQQAARHLQIVAAPKGQGSVSNYERELFGQAVPNMTNSPEMLVKAIDIARRLDDYDRSVAQIHRDVAKGNGGLPNYIEAQQRIAALGPPLSPAEMGALDGLKGGGKAAGPSGVTPSGIKWSVQ